jgi:hypothetical protein
MKERLREMLENDEYCNDQLRRANENGVTFDDLWNTKMYSAVSKVIFYLF